MALQHDQQPLSDEELKRVENLVSTLIQIDRRIKREGKKYGNDGKRDSSGPNQT
jgi:hypothetical protein